MITGKLKRSISALLINQTHSYEIKQIYIKHNITMYNYTKGCKRTSERNCDGGVAPLWTHSQNTAHNIIYSNVIIIILCSLYDRLALIDP